ncbi:three-helix bundle dimerization domain-containing protein [Embleya sp. NPDC127516]|uniref:three-helix bundle dimerization domain-containing protein n=1 Tax=Embleya sp. NPDC127516 TaxID=3363990 RepID=UPI003807DF27
MNARQDEQATVRHAAARLKCAFPSVDPATVDALVEAAQDALREAPIRTYVPILVERRARTMLADGVTPPAPATLPPDIESRGHGATAWHIVER